MNNSILIVAGEISGDLHAANVVKEFRKTNPEMLCWGIGGDALKNEGVELLQHCDEMSVMGIVEVLKQYRFFKQVFNDLLAEVDRRKPKTALLVDYPGFNLRLAVELKKRGVRVLYYISPKVWAWNKKRIPKMAKCIDHLMVIFPFELPLFKGTGLKVDYVGNPLVDQIDQLLKQSPKELPWKSDQRIALLPGSRRQEIKRILPTMLAAAKKLEQAHSDLSFLIATPNARIEALVKEIIDESSQSLKQLSVMCGNARELMRQARVAMVTSGTATLETALIGTPHILVYKTSAFTYWFGKSVVKIDHLGLANIIVKKTICPEFIQNDATADSLANAVTLLFDDSPERQKMQQDFSDLRALFGQENAAKNVAQILSKK
jgi:lipid-A-disaccharide synthase